MNLIYSHTVWFSMDLQSIAVWILRTKGVLDSELNPTSAVWVSRDDKFGILKPILCIWCRLRRWAENCKCLLDCNSCSKLWTAPVVVISGTSINQSCQISQIQNVLPILWITLPFYNSPLRGGSLPCLIGPLWRGEGRPLGDMYPSSG